MTADDLKALYGDEYPAAIMSDGVRFLLGRETRFSRTYDSDDKKTCYWLSRFMDGSALIFAVELKREWPAWTGKERMDFCHSCAWLEGQADFADMLRFIMEVGDSYAWSAIAQSVASQLPRDEAFSRLLKALHSAEIERRSNLSQAIAQTRHPEAGTTLRQELAALWSHPTLWDNDDFLNWTAFSATTSVDHLIDLGAPAAEFEDKVRRLSQHVCSGNRDSCRNFLSKHYAWLK